MSQQPTKEAKPTHLCRELLALDTVGVLLHNLASPLCRPLVAVAHH